MTPLLTLHQGIINHSELYRILEESMEEIAMIIFDCAEREKDYHSSVHNTTKAEGECRFIDLYQQILRFLILAIDHYKRKLCCLFLFPQLLYFVNFDD